MDYAQVEFAMITGSSPADLTKNVNAQLAKVGKDDEWYWEVKGGVSVGPDGTFYQGMVKMELVD